MVLFPFEIVWDLWKQAHFKEIGYTLLFRTLFDDKSGITVSFMELEGSNE